MAAFRLADDFEHALNQPAVQRRDAPAHDRLRVIGCCRIGVPGLSIGFFWSDCHRVCAKAGLIDVAATGYEKNLSKPADPEIILHPVGAACLFRLPVDVLVGAKNPVP